MTKTVKALLMDFSIILTPLYYEQFSGSQRYQISYNLYLYLSKAGTCVCPFAVRIKEV